jgi:transcription elongation factor GreA
LFETKSSSDGIQIGSTIMIEDSRGRKETFKIVVSAETDPRAGMISYESPLGQALLNHVAGDDILVRAPGGIASYRLISVK